MRRPKAKPTSDVKVIKLFPSSRTVEQLKQVF